MRTARSRPSGKQRFDFLLMAPSSQSVEPSQNPGQFTLPSCLNLASDTEKAVPLLRKLQDEL